MKERHKFYYWDEINGSLIVDIVTVGQHDFTVNRYGSPIRQPNAQHAKRNITKQGKTLYFGHKFIQNLASIL